MSDSLIEINGLVSESSAWIALLRNEISKVIVGQRYMIDRLIVALISNGHILIEGVPGLAKTLAIKTFSEAIKTKFQRIQFTPDLLPADILGTMIYNPKTAEFYTKKGPIFANIILADEINRAPAKVQSALLECMQEKQITIGDETHKLEEPFLVCATENPIDQEGTYPLPEAQIDRFMMKLHIDYQTKLEEAQILKKMSITSPKNEVKAVIDTEKIFETRKIIDMIYVDDKVQEYIIDIIFATRKPSDYGIEIDHLVQFGASPRATIALTLGAKAWAFMQGRGYVVPQDVKAIGMDVLRHRIIPTYEAEAEEMSSEMIVKRILNSVKVP